MTAIIDTVRTHVGRRHRITRAEMRAILAALAEAQLVELDNGWQQHRQDGDHAAAWTDACRGIIVVSVLAPDDAPAARLASSNPGSIRYDSPGGMHPLLRASVMFAPAGLDAGYLRSKATRVLLVE